jgi:hypothetical protein
MQMEHMPRPASLHPGPFLTHSQAWTKNLYLLPPREEGKYTAKQAICDSMSVLNCVEIVVIISIHPIG